MTNPIPVIRFVEDTGNIIRVYDNIKAMADIEEISLQTAFYRTSKKAEPIYGERFMFENDYIKLFPKSDYAKNPEKVKELFKMAKAKVSEKSSATEMELLNQPATEPAKKKPGRKKKSEPANEISVSSEISEEKNEPPKTQPDADMVNHPSHYCTGEVECWDAMMSAFGAEWMKAYANISAFKYAWRAKHKGKFAEDMRKAAWYNTKAAELEETING